MPCILSVVDARECCGLVVVPLFAWSVCKEFDDGSSSENSLDSSMRHVRALFSLISKCYNRKRSPEIEFES